MKNRVRQSKRKINSENETERKECTMKGINKEKRDKYRDKVCMLKREIKTENEI